MEGNSPKVKARSRAVEIFTKAPPNCQAAIQDILKEERAVANMQRRPDIHNRIYEHIRRLIK